MIESSMIEPTQHAPSVGEVVIRGCLIVDGVLVASAAFLSSRACRGISQEQDGLGEASWYFE
ncbi:MAG: hypothetical protein ACOCTG_04265 [Bacteroidota bacterium]